MTDVNVNPSDSLDDYNPTYPEQDAEAQYFNPSSKHAFIQWWETDGIMYVMAVLMASIAVEMFIHLVLYVDSFGLFCYGVIGLTVVSSFS